jgi:23S rRNA (cytosine1962-C5)-methyltransferase
MARPYSKAPRIGRENSKPRRPPPPGSESWRHPWVQLKYFSYNPCIFPGMIAAVSPDVAPGQWVHVYDRNGLLFGQGFYNPPARVPLRVLYHGREPVGEEHVLELLRRAVDFRLETLKLPAGTDAFRVIHSDGDGLSGLSVDRYADVLSIEAHSLGIFQRLPQWLPFLHQRLGTKRAVVAVDPKVASLERIPEPEAPSDPVRSVRVREHGVRFEINFEEGHKTGFFCDQRENRRRFSSLVKDRRVLDLCCYTGGFALAAKVRGEAGEVTGVDLDEKAIAQARRNANLNQARVSWVHVDAFSFARQMKENGEQWDAVVLDPPKLILSREEAADGQHKYEDLNSLAIGLVRTGGMFVTCSCSGLISEEHFENTVVRSAHRLGRRLQFFHRSGAGEDHPDMSHCPEGRYLKVLWARVW